MTYPLTDKNQILDSTNILLSSIRPLGNTYTSINKDETIYYIFSNNKDFAYSTSSITLPTSVSYIVITPNTLTITNILAVEMQGTILLNGNNIAFTVIGADNGRSVLRLVVDVPNLTNSTTTINIIKFVANKIFTTDLYSYATITNRVVMLSAYLYTNVNSGLNYDLYINRYKINNGSQTFDTTIFKDNLTGSQKFITPNLIDNPSNGYYLYVLEYSSSITSTQDFISYKRGLNTMAILL